MTGALQSSESVRPASRSPTPPEAVIRTLRPIVASLPIRQQTLVTPSPKTTQGVSVARAVTPSCVRRATAVVVPSSGASAKRGRSASPGGAAKRRQRPQAAKKGKERQQPSRAQSGGSSSRDAGAERARGSARKGRLSGREAPKLCQSCAVLGGFERGGPLDCVFVGHRKACQRCYDKHLGCNPVCGQSRRV